MLSWCLSSIFFTSILAALVVFAVLGFKANVINEMHCRVWLLISFTVYGIIVFEKNLHPKPHNCLLMLFLLFRNSEMIIKLVKMGNISQDIIPHHINFSAVTAEDYDLVMTSFKK